MDDVVIIGGKGTAINVAEQIDDARHRFGFPLRVVGFAIDDPALGPSINGFPIVCGTRDVRGHLRETDSKILFALYRPDVMKERVALLDSYGLPAERFTTFVHPLAYVARSATISEGSIVFASSSVMKGVAIERHCIVNCHVTIEHDARIGANSFLAAGACIGANVELGRGVFVGLNATLRENVKVGSYGFVGMSSAVLGDVDEGARVYGNPAGSPS
jgi:sugar O-acyltransferase (sialic acid O-acetyltransferase NeuD family)